MTKKYLYIICSLLLWALPLAAQVPDSTTVVESENLNESFWRATNLLPRGRWELKVFNSLYTQKNIVQNPVVENGTTTRSTYFSTFALLLIGTDRAWNWGLDAVYKSNVTNDLARNSPFKALQFQRKSYFQLGSQGDSLRNGYGETIKTQANIGLSHLGAKIKLQPWRKVPYLSLLQTVYVPIERGVDGQFISFTQLFYDRLLGSDQQLFVEASVWMPLAPNFRFTPQLKAFYSYYPNRRWTIYGMWNVPYELGAGTKFMLRPNVELELLYTYYLPIKALFPDRLPETFNFGVRMTPWD